MRFIIYFWIVCGFATTSLSAQEHSVYFDSNTFLLNETQKATLTSLFSSEEEMKITIAVEGFCDDIGSDESNQILSQKRADEVAHFLQNELQLVVSNSIGKSEISLPENTLNADEIRKNNRVVTIRFSKEIVEVKLDSVEKKPTQTNYKTFSDELKKGDRIIVNNLIFMGSLTYFQSPEEAEAELEKIISYLKTHPNTKIEIQGHVCCISNSFKDAFDRNSRKNNLSETRAKKIYDYFIEKGIASNRMTHKGYGRQFPIPGGEEHDNKRVEILIVED